MAVNPHSAYPTKTTAPTAEYPYGGAQNVTTPGDGTGTPWIANLINDIFGFQQSLLSEAGIVPSGSPDTANNSQYLIALSSLFAPLSSPALTGTPTINGVNLSPYNGRNLLINSNGVTNKRAYSSGTPTTVANQYTIDMFRVVTLGQNLTFTTTSGVTTFTAPSGGVDLPIENLSVIGGSYVLSFIGTATAVVSQSTDNVTYNTVTPSAGVYTITPGYYVRIRFSGGTFSKAKFEEGSIATPWSPYNGQFGGEIQAANRYLKKFTIPVGEIIGIGMCQSATSAMMCFQTSKMRVNPTVTYAGGLNVIVGNTSYAVTSGGTLYSSSDDMYTITFAVASGLTAGSAVSFIGVSTAGTILLSSEL